MLRHFLPRNVAVIVVLLLSIFILGSLAITIGLALISQEQELIDSVATFLNSLVPFVERLEELLRERNLEFVF